MAFRGKVGESKTIGDLGVMLQTFGDLILAMCTDLGLSNLGIDKGSFAAHLILRHGDKFLSKLKSNPEMSPDKYDQLEKRLDKPLDAHRKNVD